MTEWKTKGLKNQLGGKKNGRGRLDPQKDPFISSVQRENGENKSVSVPETDVGARNGSRCEPVGPVGPVGQKSLQPI